MSSPIVAPIVPQEQNIVDDHSNIDAKIDLHLNHLPPNTNLIEDNNALSDANIFCLVTFVDKQTGTL
jgi:hypothetical protein